jgi:hypothetical protein
VGEAYRQLIKDWAEVLPTRSVCLRVPVIAPSEYQSEAARLRQREVEEKDRAIPTEESSPQ